MEIKEFNQMLHAIEDDKPFSVDFSLQHSSEGKLTLQHLLERVEVSSFCEFMERIEMAEPPEYKE